MNNQTKQVLQKGILGDQSENPYSNIESPNQQPINHQAEFEAQYDKNIHQNQHQHNDIGHNADEPYAFEENGTYCRTGNFSSGFIETDLRIVKQKGIEERCVSISIINNAETAEVYEESNIILLKMDIKSEEQFRRFKEFISKLEWND